MNKQDKKMLLVFLSGIIVAIMFATGLVGATMSFSNYADFKQEGSKYGTIDVWNGNWILHDEKVSTKTLIDNTDYCIKNCSFSGEGINYKPLPIFDDMKFYDTTTGDEVKLKDYQEYYSQNTEEYQIDVPDYKNVCKIEINGTSCHQEQTGTHKETATRDVWIKYNKGDLITGNYKFKALGEKEIRQSVEWIGEQSNVKYSQWATWSDGLNVGIKAYYNLSSAAETTKGFANITGGTMSYTSTGIIGNAGNLSLSGTDYIADGSFSELEFVNEANDNITTLNFWVKSEKIVNNREAAILDKIGGAGYWMISEGYADGSQINFQRFNTDGLNWLSPAGTLKTASFTMITMVGNKTDISVYINGTFWARGPRCYQYLKATTGDMRFASDTYQGLIDEMGWWDRTLSASEISDLYNAGVGITYSPSSSIPINLITTLVAPANDTVTSSSSSVFNSSATVTNGNLTNATLSIWYVNGSFVGSATNEVLGNGTNSTNWTSSNTLGVYLWNAYWCSTNGTYTLCDWADDNRTFTVGASVIAERYSNSTYETNKETFNMTVSVVAGAGLSLVNFIYKGIDYPVTDITYVGNNVTLNKVIDIPLNINLSGNDTNSFYWEFVYNGGAIQIMPTRTQTSQYIKFNVCNTTLNQAYINFTSKDETYDNLLNTPFTATFYYWLGYGNIKKNVSLNDLSKGNSTFNFCFNRVDKSIYTNGDINYQADLFSPNEYHLINSTLSNVTSFVNLYSLNTTLSTKFYITAKKGGSFIDGGIINIQKFFVGEGIYKTTGLAVTDASGKFAAYLDLDKNYRFTAIYHGEVIGPVDNKASCSAAPCSFDLIFPDITSDIYAGYNAEYGSNIQSSLIYDSATKAVTYTFIDTTGLAHYFRLVAQQTSYNGTDHQPFCDLYSYTSAGTLGGANCNLTGQTGDWYATGYTSRSPEVIDKIISFVLSSASMDLGFMGLFLNFAIILTVVIGAAVISRGSPSTVLFALGGAILLLKLMTVFPFSWAVVSAVEVVIIFILFKIET